LTDYVATRWYRAPELLVGGGSYGKEVDVWSVGCIMGELVDGKPLIPGDNEVDQLYKTVKLLGAMTHEHQTKASLDARFKLLKFREVGNLENLDKGYSGRLSRVALSFMKGCLKMDPKERFTALDALRHPYFDNIRDRCYEEK
jgi:cyclin-dependent kinase-like